MAWNEAPRPADHRVASSTVHRNIFLNNEPVVFTLTTGSADHYEVRNYYGDVVKTGPVTGTSLDLGIMPLGWFKLYLIRPVAIAAPWLLAGGETYFVVCRPGMGLPARPDKNANPGADPHNEGVEYPAAGFTRIGPYRHSVAFGSSHDYQRDLALVDVAKEASTWGTPDPQRPLVPIANFPNGDFAANAATLTADVNAFVAAGCPTIEAQNEPNVGISVASDYLPEFTAFSNAVRTAGGAAAGPCTITIEGMTDTDASSGLSWLQKFLIAGGGNYLDVISFHNYNGVGGSLRVGRKTMDGFVNLLARYGQQNKPRYNTEAFSYFAHVYGSTEVRLQTQQTMLEMHLLEQYGVPKERTSCFYPRSHGFWDYPSWWINSESDQTPNPLVAVARVWSQELVNKAYAARLDFGSEDDQFLGSRFTGPGGSVVALQSDGREASVRLAATGATSVQVVDAWGNIATTPVTGGTVSVAVDQLPHYVRCPLGVTVTPVQVDYGVDVTGPQLLRSTVSAPAAVAGYPATAVVDGSPSTYRASAESLPAAWTLTFPEATRFDRVLVRTAVPWQHESGLLDFDVDALISGTWTTVATFTEPTKTLTWASHADVGRGFTDSYYSRKSCFVAELPDAVSATAVRVNARDTTYGGGATLSTTNGGGLAPGPTGQTGPRRLCLSEVRAYLSKNADGGTAIPGQPMLIVGG